MLLPLQRGTVWRPDDRPTAQHCCSTPSHVLAGVNTVHFSPDGELLVSGSDDMQVGGGVAGDALLGWQAQSPAAAQQQ